MEKIYNVNYGSKDSEKRDGVITTQDRKEVLPLVLQ